LKELTEDKKLIHNKNNTIRCCNYPYIQGILQDDHKQYENVTLRISPISNVAAKIKDFKSVHF